MSPAKIIDLVKRKLIEAHLIDSPCEIEIQCGLDALDIEEARRKMAERLREKRQRTDAANGVHTAAGN